MRFCGCYPVEGWRHDTDFQGRFAEMVEEVTADCYNDSEKITGWFTMIEDNLAVTGAADWHVAISRSMTACDDARRIVRGAAA